MTSHFDAAVRCRKCLLPWLFVSLLAGCSSGSGEDESGFETLTPEGETEPTDPAVSNPEPILTGVFVDSPARRIYAKA